MFCLFHERIEMDFRKAQARQPEIIRSIQRDNVITKDLSEDFSDLLRLTGHHNWIKYNHLCQVLADISYHGFASLNNLQTLGEEYTGIMQLDSHYKNIPSKLVQITAILLQFGGEIFYIKLLRKAEQLIANNDDITIEAKNQIKTLLHILRNSQSFLYALHKSIFYVSSGNYHISKRIMGINYVLIRNWLRPQISMYGYKILGLFAASQIFVTSLLSISDIWTSKCNLFNENGNNESKVTRSIMKLQDETVLNEVQCALCLETRQNTSLTQCGHLFCWTCILDWLDESNQCPLCREPIKKSRIIQLRNFY